MNRSILLLAATAVAGAALALPASAAPPKPITGTVAVNDPTPDPTGGNIASPANGVCAGLLPAEGGAPVTFPSGGKLKVDISGFQGDWGLAIRDSSGKFLAGDDVNPPAVEVVATKLKKGGKYTLQACNLGGTPLATLKYTFTPS